MTATRLHTAGVWARRLPSDSIVAAAVALLVTVMALPQAANAMGDPGFRYEIMSEQSNVGSTEIQLEYAGVTLTGSANMFIDRVTVVLDLTAVRGDATLIPGVVVFRSIGNPSHLRRPFRYRYTLRDASGSILQDTSVTPGDLETGRLEDQDTTVYVQHWTGDRASYSADVSVLYEIVTVPKNHTLVVVYHFHAFDPDWFGETSFGGHRLPDTNDFSFVPASLGFPVELLFVDPVE